MEHLRCLSPSGLHKTYRFQRRNKEGRWLTEASPEIAALNKHFKLGILNRVDADARSRLILKALYEERDKNRVDLTMRGNLRILNAFLIEKYPAARVRRMASRSLQTEKYYFYRALRTVGNLPVDGTLEPLQNRMDEDLAATPRIHKRLTTSLNRLRKWLSLPMLQHLLPEHEEVVFVSEAYILEQLSTLPETIKILCAVAFYTGLRRGEIFGLRPSDLQGDILYVQRQLTQDKLVTLPKHRKKRKAFILPGGVPWVQRLLALGPLNRDLKINVPTRRAFGVRFHDLRHSYAVHLISKGASMDWVAQSLGHSREVCERWYAGHMLQDDSVTLLRLLLEKQASNQATQSP